MRAALSPEGGVFVADLLGGHAAEAPVRLPRQNAVTGLHYVWEQGAFNPVTCAPAGGRGSVPLYL